MIDVLKVRPREMREIYLMMGATCLLLASISHDLGEPSAGTVQVRSAEVFAELAEHQGLLGWALCTQAMIDSWAGRPEAVLVHASRGQSIAMMGHSWLRLRGLEVRALARLGRRAEARRLLDDLDEQSPNLVNPADEGAGMDGLGALFSFPQSRWTYYAAVSHSVLGNYREAELRVLELGHAEQPAPTPGAWPVSWALGRSYLALASLDQPASSDTGPERALRDLAPVLSLPATQRINQLDQVFCEIGTKLTAPALSGNAAANNLLDAVRAFRASSTSQMAELT